MKSLGVLEQAGQQMMAHLLLVQGITMFISVALSAMVFFPLGTITANLGGQCLLFSRIYLTAQDFTFRTSANLDLALSEFGSMNDCDYTTFLSVTVTVAGLIFLWFLLHLGRVTESDRSESGFLFSTFLFYIVLFICAIISSIKISSGFSYWCDNITVCVKSKCEKLECDRFSKLTVENIQDASKFYTYFELAEISSWLLALILLIECVVTSQRIYQDFKISVLEEEQLEKKLDAISESSVNGIINRGSDEYVEASRVGQVSASSLSVNTTLADVTVHNDSVTLAPSGSYEMSCIAGTSEVRIVSEAESKKKQSDLLEQADVTDFDKSSSRRRKPQTTEKLNENDKIKYVVKTEGPVQKPEDQDKGNA